MPKAQKGRKYMKKNLKTRIAAGLLAASTAVSSTAFAADLSSLYAKESDAVDIIYNGDVVTYTDAQPQIINDRVMIPFRAVLENMGAQVSFDEQSRMVTAVRGATTVKFSLDSNVIDIDKNGEKSQLTMDVPMAVVNDRTLVPIRFMSNALGMNVGWDSDLRTVAILDTESYINELNALPNISKLMKLENKVPALENGAVSLALDFATAGADDSMAFDAKIDATYDVSCIDGVIGGKTVIDLDIDGLNELLKQLLVQNIELKNIEKAVIDIVADDGVLYFKTDLIEKLAAECPEIEKLQSVAKFADKNTWFKWDVEKTFEELAQENAAFQPIADMFRGGITGLNNMTGEDAFKMIATRTGDVELYDVIAIDTAMETYKLMDKYITIDIAENGDYTMKFDIPKEMLIEVLKSMGMDTGSEEMKKVMDAISFTMKAESTLKDGKTASDVDYTVGVNFTEGENSLKFNIKLTVKATGEMEAKKDAEAAKVPVSAVDIVKIIEAL